MKTGLTGAAQPCSMVVGWIQGRRIFGSAEPFTIRIGERAKVVIETVIFFNNDHDMLDCHGGPLFQCQTVPCQEDERFPNGRRPPTLDKIVQGSIERCELVHTRKIYLERIESSRNSPDESQTSINVRVFPALLQDRREVQTATSTSGNPNAWSGSDLAIFLAFGRTPSVGCS